MNEIQSEHVCERFRLDYYSKTVNKHPKYMNK